MTDRAPDKTDPVPPTTAPATTTPLPELYGRYRKELIAFVRLQFGKGPPEPEDVAQQAFLNYAALGPTDTIVNARAFLYRTARNIVLNHRKHEQIGRRFLETNPDPKDIRDDRDDFNPEVVLLGREGCNVIEEVIRAMPARRRQMLLLNRIEGITYAEIGRRMGHSESAVRKQVALAIRECGAALAHASTAGSRTRNGS